MESVSSEEKLRFGNSTLPPRKNTEEGGAGEERGRGAGQVHLGENQNEHIWRTGEKQVCTYMLSSGPSMQWQQRRERKAAHPTSTSSWSHRLELPPPPPSARPGPQAPWGGPATRQAPSTPPLPSRDKGMTQISYRVFNLSGSSGFQLLYSQVNSKRNAAYLPKSMRRRLNGRADSGSVRVTVSIPGLKGSS